jgi:ABC-type multidrug transport system ATPase subunit
LDEPDSGLDGTMARQLMENLRVIADKGKIVLVISHSPDRAFELFDRIIVLAKSSEEEGRLVFYGSPEEALTFFEVDSLESIVSRINYPEEGGEGLADYFVKRYQESIE